MCARKLGRVKEAAKIFKELNKDTHEASNLAWLNSAENLIECYLELGDYANAQEMVKFDFFVNLPAPHCIDRYSSRFYTDLIKIELVGV